MALLEFKERCQNPNCRSWFPAGKSHICYQEKNHTHVKHSIKTYSSNTFKKAWGSLQLR